MLKKLLLILWSTSAFGAVAPILFYSDITDGPRDGGENAKGAYIRVFGRNFGATRGTSTISIGGTNADNYPCWGSGNALNARGDDMACFQLATTTPTGAQTIKMTVGGVDSNTLPFFVRADGTNSIYCVQSTGADTNTGHFGSCFLTLSKATGSTPVSGAIIYDIDVNPTTTITPNNSGSANNYSALLAYPGNTLTIDPASSYAVNVQNGNHYWVIGGFFLKSETGTAAVYFHGGNSSSTLTYNDHFRLVDNDITCPNIPATTQIGCFISSIATNLAMLGNNFHDVGCNVTGNPTGNQGHVNYYTTDVSYVEIGWNNYQNNCLRGEVHVHSSPLSIGGKARTRLMRPVLGQTAGGALGARTYYVRTTWQYDDPTAAETYGSYEISKAVSANNFLTVHPYDSRPQCCGLINVFPVGATTTQIFANIFAGSTADSETFQIQLTCTVSNFQPTCPTWTQAAEITSTGRAWPTVSSGSTDISGRSQIGIKVHDNVFSNFPSEGVLFGNLDSNCKSDPADADTSLIYNNQFIHGGKGPQNQGQHIAIGGGGTENGRAPCGTVLIQNNTFYDIGSAKTGAYGFIWPPPNNSLPDATWQMDDNIVYQLTGEPYFCSGCPAYSGSLGQITGNNNDWFTSTANVGPPAGTGMGSALNVDPLFTVTAFPGGDFHLQNASPMKNVGVTTFPTSDFDGLTRPQGATYDIGAFEVPATFSIVTGSPLPPGTTGAVYSKTLSASGGLAPYGSWTVTVGSLPTGLTLGPTSGLIAGTPTGTGTSTFTVQVTDSTPANTSRQFSLTINSPMSITTATLPAATKGVAYSTTVAATGGATPYTWSVSVGSLPTGLTLNASTGAITGTATGSTSTFTVQVSDSTTPANTATKQFSITVNVCAITSTSPFQGGTQSVLYANFQIATQFCTAPLAWTTTAGALPTSLTLGASTGIISGTPSAAGPYTFTPQVTDVNSVVASLSNAQIVISPPPPVSGSTAGTGSATVSVTVTSH